jgi:hypothetical protein
VRQDRRQQLRVWGVGTIFADILIAVVEIWMLTQHQG